MNKEDYNLSEVLDKMTDELKHYLNERHISNPVVVGIHSGGVWLAEMIHQRLAIDEPIGELNISFYRDDFSRIGLHPHIKPSKLPFSLEDRHIILVDDVLHTGRTIRAAMNELFDYGRPASIILTVIFDRDGKELPIEAQITGIKERIDPTYIVDIKGPDNPELTIVRHD